MYKVEISIDHNDYVIYGNNSYAIYNEINKHLNLVNLLDMGYGFCVNSEIPMLEDLKNLINKEEMKTLTIDDIKKINIRLTVGDIICKNIVEI